MLNFILTETIIALNRESRKMSYGPILFSAVSLFVVRRIGRLYIGCYTGSQGVPKSNSSTIIINIVLKPSMRLDFS